MKLSSWGRLDNAEHNVQPITDTQQVPSALLKSAPGIAYGMGRSYGDVCLNPGGTVWRTTALDRFIEFDEESGKLVCEAGMVLRDIQRLVIPRGWSLPVTPGTELITVGGAIANDVHGKNHHVLGTFGAHVRKLTLIRTDGTRIECGPDTLPDWFAATVGGIGLTGLITKVEIQLRRTPGPWFETETIPFTDLEQFFALSADSDPYWENSVSWIDCVAGGTGRGLFMRGNAVSVDSKLAPRNRELVVPVVPPISMVNGVTLRALNSAYFQFHRRQTGKKLMHYESFLYPLDKVLEWNRLYGPHGFYQYQSVVPHESALEATSAMLEEITASKQGSFLAVLKTFGDHTSPGMLSFPRPGVTLALDFPNRGEPTLRLLERLDAIVNDVGGRLYLAKDARMSRKTFEAGYQRINEFLNFRDPGMTSAMSRRLMDN
ncbi:MAG TPA: FAD-binding oxidoreductase [Candidatus Nanopelagicaceae bacterium]|nr:FAD-binding oxidoreductase [Candidatus Nanopelagicaceae bacterium]